MHRQTVTRLYQIWLLLGVTLIINFVACLLVLISGSADGGKDLGGSITYVPLCTSPRLGASSCAHTGYTRHCRYMPIIGILSFLLWYRPIYNGYMKVSVVELNSACRLR